MCVDATPPMSAATAETCSRRRYQASLMGLSERTKVATARSRKRAASWSVSPSCSLVVGQLEELWVEEGALLGAGWDDQGIRC